MRQVVDVPPGTSTADDLRPPGSNNPEFLLRFFTRTAAGGGGVRDALAKLDPIGPEEMRSVCWATARGRIDPQVAASASTRTTRGP